MFCCTLLYVQSIAIILMGKRELIALPPWCLVMVEWLFLPVPWGCLQFVIVVFSDHTQLLFLVPCAIINCDINRCATQSQGSAEHNVNEAQELPEHLKKMYEDNISELSSEEKQQFKNL